MNATVAGNTNLRNLLRSSDELGRLVELDVDRVVGALVDAVPLPPLRSWVC